MRALRALGTALTAISVGVGLTACSTSSPAAGNSSPGVSLASVSVAGGGATAPFHVAGNKIVGSNGQQFVEYGFVTYCLAHPSIAGCTPATPGGQSPDLDRIRAAGTFWHANSDRIQVAQEYLFDQPPHDSAYLAQVDAQVQLATSLGMVPIVSLQEEPFKDQGPALPTASAVRFWQFMADHYKNNPQVMFDLYNEPRLKAYHGSDWLWNIWRNGGKVDEAGPPAVHETFVGMQAVVDAIRTAGATNVIVAEGNQTAHDLSGIPKYALSGANIAYGVQPGLRPNRDDTPTRWAANWGNLSDSVPIVMTAWKGWPGSNDCNTNAPTLLPQEMNYLRSKGLGLIVWALQGGSIIVGDNLQQPTSYQGVTTQPCNAQAPDHPDGLELSEAAHTSKPGKTSEGSTPTQSTTSPPTSAVGPGQLIKDFFVANSHTTPR